MMLYESSLAYLLLYTALVDARNRSDTGSSKLMIHVPSNLYKKEGYDHRQALFGEIPYRGSLSQQVYYANSTFCDQPSYYPVVWNPPFILMIDQGAWAAGVLIADNTCSCFDQDCVDTLPPSAINQCEVEEPIMADDGSGSDISIPSFLMFKRDADLVKNALATGYRVQMEMAWGFPRPDGPVEYSLWTNPADNLSRSFVRTFKKVAVALADDAIFTPHMYINDGESVGCRDNKSSCGEHCTNHGRYCSNGIFGITGSMLVKESLRRLCIWSEYGGDGLGKEWWDYVNEFNQHCLGLKGFAVDECVKKAFKTAGVSSDSIEQCIADSGGVERDVPNSRLQDELDAQKQNGVLIIPSVFVNNEVISDMSTVDVFYAICESYGEEGLPASCRQCASCPDVVMCLESGWRHCAEPAPTMGTPSSPNVSWPTFATSILLLIVFYGGASVWFYKRSQQQMRHHLRDIVSGYFRLEEQDTDF